MPKEPDRPQTEQSGIQRPQTAPADRPADAATAGTNPPTGDAPSVHAENPLVDVSDPSVLARYEPYLRMLARTRIRKAYQAKIGQSDMVQQVLLQAVQGLDGFRGSTEAELRGWLRQILARHLCHLDRDMHREKRDVRREKSMEQKLAQSSMRLEGLLAGEGPTPSQNVMIGESVLKLAEALERLPEAQSDAIRLHFLEGLKLSEVAEQMDKTTGAIAGLLHRGMKTLREEWEGA